MNRKMNWASRWFRRASLIAGWVLIITVVFNPPGYATPPEYTTFQREQLEDYQPVSSDLMRIWVVYVGQGDGILIQLPTKSNYDPDPTDDLNERTERIDILIDGGSHDDSDRSRMADFLTELYDQPTIEHAVITHHDSDHIKGLTYILAETPIAVASVYHNGLASYRRDKRGFTDATRTKEAVITRSNGHLSRGMAFLEPDDDGQGQKLRETDLIDSRPTLAGRLEGEEFLGDYEALADGIVHKEAPSPPDWFQRCWMGSPFINERETALSRPAVMSGIQCRVIWPLQRPRRYGDWGETINGNSLTFRLDYGDFSILFTGDLNDKSEEKLLECLRQTDQTDLLNVDVLKVPHHGSRHAFQPFFDRKDSRGNRIPVASVASMGAKGFGQSWKHPNPDIVNWLGGFHRVYHTFIHEKKFKWENLDSQSKIDKMRELNHVLIETDGQWFRITEVRVEDGNIQLPPSVRETSRGNGTRWIRAR